MTSDDRLIDLEARLAHQERMSEEISDVVIEQARTIDRLSQQVRFLSDRIGQVEAGGPASPQDEKPPPHY